MKILAIADIHNNVACVRKLRAQEANDYDAIAIAGDIGTHAAAEIFATLGTFKCPIVYVHGNWDRMPEDAKFGTRAHLVHLQVVKVAGLALPAIPSAVRRRSGWVTAPRSTRSNAARCCAPPSASPASTWNDAF